MNRFGRHSVSFIASAACLLLTGCQATLPRTPTSQPAVPIGNAELMEYLSERPFLTAEAAYRGTYMLWKSEAFPGDFDALRSALVDGRIVDRTWQHHADTRLNKGAVGYMICKVCGIKTGLNWLLTDFGRYAWRELQYRRIAGAGTEMGLLSGGEFLGILHRADAYMAGQRGGAAKQPELGARPK